MEFKPVLAKRTFVKATQFSPEPQNTVVVVGKYMKTEPNIYNPAHVDHYFETEDGEVIINHSGNLSALLKRVPFGSTVQVRYLGKATGVSKKFAKTPTNQWMVDVAAETKE